MLLAGKALEEIAKFAENLREQLSIEGVPTGMTAAHVVALGEKVFGKCRLHGRDDVSALPVGLEGLLLRKDRSDSDELEGALLWVEATASDMTVEHVCARLRPEIQVLSDSSKWRCCKL